MYNVYVVGTYLCTTQIDRDTELKPNSLEAGQTDGSETSISCSDGVTMDLYDHTALNRISEMPSQYHSTLVYCVSGACTCT